MYAIRVQVNDGPTVIAGAEDLGLLSVHLSVSGPLGPASVPARPDSEAEPRLHVGGLTSRPDARQDVHLRWSGLPDVHVGDRVTLTLLNVDAADEPDAEPRPAGPVKARVRRRLAISRDPLQHHGSRPTRTRFRGATAR